MTSMTARDGGQRAAHAAGPTSAPRPTFATIYAEHAQTVARWAARLGGPAADVEDVTQEVFLVVDRRLPEFRGDSRLTTWLFGITAKVAANERRRRRLRELWFRFAPGLVERAPAATDGALEQLEMRERRALFHRVLDSLGERHRRVLVLFELEELSVDEIAEVGEAAPWERGLRRRAATGAAPPSSGTMLAASLARGAAMNVRDEDPGPLARQPRWIRASASRRGPPTSWTPCATSRRCRPRRSRGSRATSSGGAGRDGRRSRSGSRS